MQVSGSVLGRGKRSGGGGSQGVREDRRKQTDLSKERDRNLLSALLVNSEHFTALYHWFWWHSNVFSLQLEG